MLPDGLNWVCYLAGSSKSHRENSISFIFLESPHQVDMKNVAKCWKDFLSYFTTLETYRGSTELSFYQDFAHHMAMQFLVSNFSSYNISYQYLIFYLFTSLFFFVKNLCRCFSSEFCLHSWITHCSSVSFPGIKY